MNNNFKEYGFEADFEGEILKQIGDIYVGYYINGAGCPISCQWWNNGMCSVGTDVENLYKIIPIKKEWYENPDNFPCLVIYEDKKIKLIGSYSEASKFRTYPCLLTAEGGGYLSLSKCRPATKEEVLTLIIEN